MTNRPGYNCKTGVLHLGVSDHSLIYGCRKITFIVGIHKSSAFKADLIEWMFVYESLMIQMLCGTNLEMF